MFCKNCGTLIKDDAKFCAKCGTQLDSTPVSTPKADMETPAQANASPDVEAKPIATKMEIQKSFQVPPIVFSFIGAAIVAGAFLFTIFLFDLPIIGTTLGQSEEKAAYKTFQEIVLEQVWYPDSTEFPRYNPAFVEEYIENVDIDGNEYHVFEVTAEVKTDNALGISIKDEYDILIGYPVSGKRKDYIYEFVDSEE